MIIEHLYVNNIMLAIDEEELKCILNGIPYVRIDNEIHYGNKIVFFHSYDEKESKDEVIVVKKKILGELRFNLCQVKKGFIGRSLLRKK